jgi:hypothetical protein
MCTMWHMHYTCNTAMLSTAVPVAQLLVPAALHHVFLDNGLHVP